MAHTPTISVPMAGVHLPFSERRAVFLIIDELGNIISILSLFPAGYYDRFFCFGYEQINFIHLFRYGYK